MEPEDPNRPLPKTMALDAASLGKASQDDDIPASFGQPPGGPTATPGWGAPAPVATSQGGSGLGVGMAVLAVLVLGCLLVSIVGAAAVMAGAYLYVAPRGDEGGDRVEWLETPDPPDNPDRPYAVPIDPYASERVYVPLADTTPVRGATEPLVTIVEISDFECPYCQRAATTVDQVLRESPEVRHALRHNPLPMHPNARPAAIASMEARRQFGDSGFWRLHDLLFQNREALGDGGVRRLVARAGLSTSEYDQAVSARTHDAAVDADIELARSIGANGTPTFFINGRELRGAQPIERFREVIAEELAHARNMVSAGVPAAHVYDRLIENGRRGPAPENTRPPPDAPDPNVVHDVPVAGSPAAGPADALVTVVVFSDFQCPFCSRLTPTMRSLRTRYGADLRLVFKHNPLPFHERAEPAAEASIEVLEQLGPDAFFRYHDLLFENQRALGDRDLEQYARQVGADGGRVRAAIEGRRHRAIIERDQALAASIGARGTPTSFVNGRILTGAQPESAFVTLIDAEMTRARERVAAGTPRAQVYEVITRSRVE